MASVFSLLLASLLLGLLGRKSGRFPENTATVLNAFVLDIALPALVLGVVRELHLGAELLAGAAMMWVVFLGAWALFGGLARAGLLAPRTAAALILTAGLGNTAFVGIALVRGLMGEEGGAVATVVDQLGSFLVLSSLAPWVAARAAGDELRKRELIWRVIRFPPFIALWVALLSRPLAFPAPLEALLAGLAGTMAPLALFAVGFQLRLSTVRRHLGPLSLGLCYKLVLAPALVAALLFALGSARPVVLEATVLQAAMAPMVTGAIVAQRHQLEPALASLMVGIGVLLSFATVPLVFLLLR